MWCVNLSAMVGPTHHYGGLAVGNKASQNHRHLPSNPKLAALQSLDRMWALHQSGFFQIIIPPLNLPDSKSLAKVRDIQQLSQRLSSSSMWTANTATVSPSVDTNDGRVHITPANLQANSHRALECVQTTQLLRMVFHDSKYFEVHDAVSMSDEGAANHIILGEQFSGSHIWVAVYGGRQSKVAIEQVVACHGRDMALTRIVEQNPKAIDAGVFHNDVIAVGTAGLLLVHEMAYVNQSMVLQQVQDLYFQRYGTPLQVLAVSSKEVSLEDAVQSYLFNSQLLYQEGEYTLVSPIECQKMDSVNSLITSWVSDGGCPITSVAYMDLTQSMKNGGGPACLRLKLLLTDEEWHAVDARFLFNEEKYRQLTSVVQTRYRDEVTIEDLLTPAFIEDSQSTVLAIYDMFNVR